MPDDSPGGFGFGAKKPDDASVALTDAEACAYSSVEATPIPAVIEVVLDASGSMRWIAFAERTPAPGEQSKLEVTRTALSRALDSMPDDTAAGLFFYPGRSDDVAGDCLADNTSIPISPLTAAHRDELRSALASLIAQGGTPTHDAYKRSLSQLESSPQSGDRYIVLITDGVPTYTENCVGNGLDSVSLEALAKEAERAVSRGVRTFVVGSPGSELARVALSRVASLGGTGEPGCAASGPVYCHFDMTVVSDFAAGLNAALAAIGAETLSCSYEIPDPPDGERLDVNRVNVRFTSGTGATEYLLRHSSANSCADGFQYSADGTRIVLCDATCERIRTQRDSKVEILFGCEAKVAPVQ